MIRVSEEVRAALRDRRGVVALETTLIAHGFPPGEGVEVGLASEGAVRESGAVPATIGVLDGEIVVGLSFAELERFDSSARKLGPRDVAAAAVQRVVGATTVGGTLTVCKAAGIAFLGTAGGLGGVHRGWPDPPDVSADLQALAQTQALVVSSGIKSLLDVPATAELLETLGVPVLGWQTDELPLFYAARRRGLPVSARVETAEEAARIAAAHWELDGGGLLLARPPDGSLDDIEPLIQQALAAAEAEGVHGQAVTPFVLAWLHRESGGRTLRANRALILDNNARLAGEVAAVGVIRDAAPEWMPTLCSRFWSMRLDRRRSVTDTLEDVIQVIRHPEGSVALVAESDGLIVGSLIATWDGWRGNMYRLAVSPEFRRRGIAAALVSAGEAEPPTPWSTTRTIAIVLVVDHDARCLHSGRARGTSCRLKQAATQR